MKYSAAIDLSGGEAGFALRAVGTNYILRECYVPMRGKGAAGLADWVMRQFDEHNVKPADVVEWTVGSGPGSFTGMRMAAALVEGLTFGRDVRTRCIPGALAWASCVNSRAGELIGCLFDGRNRELLLYGVCNYDGRLMPSGQAEVCDAEGTERLFTSGRYRYFIAPAQDRKAIEILLPVEFRGSVAYGEHLPLRELLFSEAMPWNNDLNALVYIRPAVFTEPLNS